MQQDFIENIGDEDTFRIGRIVTIKNIKYTLTEIIASKESGTTIYLATRETEPKNVVIKRYFTKTKTEEAANMLLLKPHLNIVECYGYDEIMLPGAIETRIVMQYCNTGNLEKYMSTHELDLKSILKIITDLSAAILYMYNKKIMHRDIRRANIFLIKKDDSLRALLGDFELSKDCSMIPNKFTDVYTDTAIQNSISPIESNMGNNYNYKVDIYCIGMIMYYLLFKTPLYNCDLGFKKQNTEMEKENYTFPIKSSHNFIICRALVHFIHQCLLIDKKRISSSELFNHPLLTVSYIELLLLPVTEDYEANNTREDVSFPFRCNISNITGFSDAEASMPAEMRINRIKYLLPQIGLAVNTPTDLFYFGIQLYYVLFGIKLWNESTALQLKAVTSHDGIYEYPIGTHHLKISKDVILLIHGCIRNRERYELPKLKQSSVVNVPYDYLPDLLTNNLSADINKITI